MSKGLAQLLACGVALTPSATLAQTIQEQLRPGNEAIQRQLDRGHDAMQQQLNRNAILGAGSPPFPLFRCDGQRPPMVGAENCANWRLMKTRERLMRKQERLIDLQIKQLEPKAARKAKADQ